MFISLSAPHALNEVDWNVIYDAWKQMETIKPLPFDNQIDVFGNVSSNNFEE